MYEPKVVIELCRRNWSGRGGYAAPTVVEWREVTPGEAAILLSLNLNNGYYWLEPDSADRTGAEGSVP